MEHAPALTKHATKLERHADWWKKCVNDHVEKEGHRVQRQILLSQR